jgi:hypothetical protein
MEAYCTTWGFLLGGAYDVSPHLEGVLLHLLEHLHQAFM